MSKYVDSICSKLYAISTERYNEELKEVKLVLAVMAQASKDVHDRKVDKRTRDDALAYFYSDHFLYHCMLAGLEDENSVRKLFLLRPRKGDNHVSRSK